MDIVVTSHVTFCIYRCFACMQHITMCFMAMVCLCTACIGVFNRVGPEEQLLCAVPTCLGKHTQGMCCQNDLVVPNLL